MRFHSVALAALIIALAPELILGQTGDSEPNAKNLHQKRDFDSEFNRMRNGHACMMSIVFIILYPLGAISIHLPIDRIPYLKNTYLRNKVPAIHAPIQILGAVMMLGAMGLGIRLAHVLDYLEHPVPAHVVIGLLVVCTILVFQPVLGILQHRYFKRTGGKSVFAYIHRWIGRGAIILGIINNGLGFQLATVNVVVPTSSYIRNFVLVGILAGIWLGLVAYDQFRAPQPKADTFGHGKHAQNEMRGGADIATDEFGVAGSKVGA